MTFDLATASLLDCQGRVSHRLTLEPDGTVRVEITSSGVVARVDPDRRVVLTPGVSLPESVIADAASMRPW